MSDLRSAVPVVLPLLSWAGEVEHRVEYRLVANNQQPVCFERASVDRHGDRSLARPYLGYSVEPTRVAIEVQLGASLSGLLVAAEHGARVALVLSVRVNAQPTSGVDGGFKRG